MTLALGYPHPDHLLSRLSAEQYRGWQEYYALEPFGDHHFDFRLIEQSVLFCNANRDAKKKPEPFTVADFAPYLAEVPEEKIIDLGEAENARLIRAQLEAMGRP